jgi:magnesium transporter
MKDCLDPKHLPKYEQNGELFFMIFRAYDIKTKHLADTVQNLTRKVAIFYRPEFLITIHRQEHPFLTKLREDWSNHPGNYTSLKILSKIIFGILSSYQPPMEQLNQQYENFEKKIFLDNAESHTSELLPSTML